MINQPQRGVSMVEGSSQQNPQKPRRGDSKNTLFNYGSLLTNCLSGPGTLS